MGYRLSLYVVLTSKHFSYPNHGGLPQMPPSGQCCFSLASHNRPFSANVTSCSLINQHCWIALVFSQNVLYDVLR